MGSIILIILIAGFFIYSFYLHIDEYIENVKDFFYSILGLILYKTEVKKLNKEYQKQSEIFFSNKKEISALTEKHNLNKNKNAFNTKFFKKYRK